MMSVLDFWTFMSFKYNGFPPNGFGPQMALGIEGLGKVVLGQMQCFNFSFV
jgi:hypothetical protein